MRVTYDNDQNRTTCEKDLLKKIAPTEFILKRKVPLWKVTNHNLQHHCGLALPPTDNFFQRKEFLNNFRKRLCEIDHFVHIEIGKQEQRLIKQKGKDLCL